MVSHALLFALLLAVVPHDPAGKLTELNAQIRREPARAELYVQRAECLAALRLRERAQADYAAALRLAPFHFDARLGAAALDYALGNDARALAHVDRALATRPGHPAALGLRGKLLLAVGRTDEAIATFQAVLAQPGQHAPELYLDWVLALESADRVDAARAAVERGIAACGPAIGLIEAAVRLDCAHGDFARALSRIDLVAAHATRSAWCDARRDWIRNAAGGARIAVDATVRTSDVGERAVPAARSMPLPVVAQPASAAALPAEQSLLPVGSIWRYRDDNSITGTAWTSPLFDDSAWPSGPAQLGYGDGDEATVIGFGPSSNNRYVTSWFRTHCTVVDPSLFTVARVRLLRDDGAVVYVNGIEVARSNMPTATVSTTTLASSGVSGADESTFYSYWFSPALLQAGDNVVAVEVHQSAANSSDLSFDLELLASTGPVGVVRGPYLQNATASSITLRWRTAIAADTRVWLGLDPHALQLVHTNPNPVVDHEVVLQPLPAGSRFYYAIGDGLGVQAGGDADHAFTTLPAVGTDAPLRCWVLGDPGTASTAQRQVRDAFAGYAAQQPADLILMLGDQAYSSGTDAQYQAGIFDVYGTFLRNTCVWPCLGNHDAGSASSLLQSGPYYDAFTLPRNGEAGGLPSGTEAYYSFDCGKVHFVCLDSQDSDRTAAGAMLQWLTADLASTNAAWVIAFFHHPPYTKGTHDSDSLSDSGGRMTDMRQVALPILEAAGVDLVLCGHSHGYERSYLLDGHYGTSTTLQPVMVLDEGDGAEDGDGSYHKPHAGLAPHEGAVYVVAGSSGQVGSAALDHPAMHVGLAQLGSLVLDIRGDRVDAAFVTSTGSVADHFTLAKGRRQELRRDHPALSVSTGGQQSFALDAGAAHAGEAYVIAGSFGTVPGIQVGALHVPLNADGWLSGSLAAANSSMYPGSLGLLDGNGAATAAFVLPPQLGSVLLGASLYHAFVTFDGLGFQFASNAVRVRFMP